MKKSFEERQKEKREKLDNISNEYQKNIDFVLKTNKETVESGVRDKIKHEKMLKAYRKAQELAWKYPRVVMGKE